MASTWTATWRRFLSPFTVGAKAGGGLSAGVKAVVLGGVLPFSRGRLISTCSVLWMRRRKFNPNPDGVPKWANYDGNQKCIDGIIGFSWTCMLTVHDVVANPWTRVCGTSDNVHVYV